MNSFDSVAAPGARYGRIRFNTHTPFQFRTDTGPRARFFQYFAREVLRFIPAIADGFGV